MTTSATLLFLNGPILTLDPARPDAQALAVRGERILALGTEVEVRALAGPEARVIDLAGRALLPGLADAHFHLVYWGMTLRQAQSRLPSWLDLSSATDAGQVVEAVRQAAASPTPGGWVYGRGWDPARLGGGRMPTRAELDAVAPDRPVLLSRADGHLCLANSEALRRADIARETPDPPGGIISRYADGEPTGALAEAALYLAWNKMMEELTPADFRAPLLAGCRAALQAGLTSVHAVLLENVQAELEAIRALDESGELPLRCYLMVPVESLDKLPRDLLHWRGKRARVGAAKLFADGTIFAGTAALRAPYADNPASLGELSYTPEVLQGLVRKIKDAGLQPAVHAVGDRAIEAVLDAVEAVYGPDSTVVRPRIEHGSIQAPDLIARMASLGAVASMQTRRGTALVEGRLGRARSAWTNPWRALVDVGVPLAAGSDAPFIRREPGSLPAASEAFRRGLSLEEALRTATAGPAYAAFQEKDMGMLRPGMLADFTVLDRDPRGLAAEAFAALKPVVTIVGGEVVWEAGASA